MSTFRKLAFFVCALIIGLSIAVALVRAASPGQDFDWLSVSQGGMRIGAAPGEGEGEGEGEGQGQPEAPPANTLEFAAGAGDGQIWFQDGGFAVFRNNGGIATVADGELPENMLMMNSEPAAMLISEAALLVSARFESVEGEMEGEGESGGAMLVPNSGVVCMPDGDVVVRLGHPVESATSMMEGTGVARDAYSEGIPRRIPVRWPYGGKQGRAAR